MGLDEFKVEVEIKENRLLCKIILNQEADCELKYAFYLLLNGQKSEIRNYTDSNKVEFQLVEDGEYKVMGFVMQKTERYINTSQVIKFVFDEQYPVPTITPETERIPISIFGSCISRDLLEFDFDNKLELQTYIARQSIVSAVSKPVTIDIEDIKLASNFKRRCVYNDFKKETFSLLEADKSKYIIIDLIDERFKLVKYRRGAEKSLITYSAELQESMYIKHPRFVDKRMRHIFGRNKYYVGNISLEQYVKTFCYKIKEIYSEENIIIHKCKMSMKYKDIQGSIQEFPRNYYQYNTMSNKILEYMYDCLKRYLPNAKVIDISDKYYADEKHKWGLSPMHYQKEYYLETIKILNEYLVGRR